MLRGRIFKNNDFYDIVDTEDAIWALKLVHQVSNQGRRNSSDWSSHGLTTLKKKKKTSSKLESIKLV